MAASSSQGGPTASGEHAVGEPPLSGQQVGEEMMMIGEMEMEEEPELEEEKEKTICARLVLTQEQVRFLF